MRKKREATMEERVTKVETELPHIFRQLKDIQKQLNNDIPHQITEVADAVERIGRKYGDLDAISRFLSVCVKGVALVLGILWSARQIFSRWGAGQ